MKRTLLFLAVILGCFISTDVYSQIKCLENIDEHKPIVLESEQTANIYSWRIPKNMSKILVDNGKIVHCWASPGKYDISLMTINVDFDKKDIQYNEHEITINIVKGNIPSPDDPAPKPDNPVIPTTAFKEEVKKALSKIGTSGLTYKVKIAEIYSGIANEAEENNNSWDAATMVNEAKVRNASALPSSALNDWKDFWSGLATAFKNLKLASTDLQGHIKAFKEVGEVLNGK